MPRRRCKDVAAEQRAFVDLRPAAKQNPQTSKRRTRCIEQFLLWLCKHVGYDSSLESIDASDLNTALIGYGKFLFYSGEPKYMYAETINAVVDLKPHLRGHLAAPWATLCRWEETEPTKRSMIMPAALFQAAVALSLLWGWPKFAGALLIGFHALMRPNEFLPLQRKDLVLPCDLLTSELIAYIRIWHSKTSRFMLRQHSRVSDSASVVFLDKVFGKLDPEELLFGCSAGVFRNRWNKIFNYLGVCTLEKENGITPKSLRGSGASWFFHKTESLDKVMWRGRWQSRRTLEFYLQDVMGQTLLTNLSPHHRKLVLELASASSELLVES